MHNFFDTQAFIEVVIAQAMRHINTKVAQVVNLQASNSSSSSGRSVG